jgi:uncharacterized protein involved in tellurium resistance
MRKRASCYPHRVFSLLLLVGPAVAFAEPVELRCDGVNYIYESGIGTVPAKRQASQRSIKLDLSEMTVELANGEKTMTAALVKKYGDYQGFFPNNRMVFGTPVLGEQIEIGSELKYLEIRFLLEGDKKYLSFTGNCEH